MEVQGRDSGRRDPVLDARFKQEWEARQKLEQALRQTGLEVPEQGGITPASFKPGER